MKIAIVGLGKISNYHLNAIKRNSSIEIVGGFDINGDPENKLGDSKLFDTMDDLLSDDSIDTVLLLVPSQFKYPLSLEVLKSGKRLITEKPATNNIDELEVLSKTAKEQDVSIYGAFHSRFSPTAVELKKLLDKGEYKREDIASIEIWADSPHIINGKIVGKSSERTSFSAEGSNILSELLLYIDGINLISAEADKSFKDFGIDEVQTKFSGDYKGINISASTSWIRGKKEKGVKITFKDGRELLAIHTDQKIYENGEVIFDGTSKDPEIARMQKEYNAIYESIGTSDLEDNTMLLKQVAQLSDQVMEMSDRVDGGILNIH